MLFVSSPQAPDGDAICVSIFLRIDNIMFCLPINDRSYDVNEKICYDNLYVMPSLGFGLRLWPKLSTSECIVLNRAIVLDIPEGFIY